MNHDVNQQTQKSQQAGNSLGSEIINIGVDVAAVAVVTGSDSAITEAVSDVVSEAGNVVSEEAGEALAESAAETGGGVIEGIVGFIADIFD